MAEINLLNTHPAAHRDYDKRAAEKTPEIIALAKQFEKDFFDGDRKSGYGGYKYDGRWKAVAKKMHDFYSLPADASILDIGCAKGFLLNDFKEFMPDCTVAGIDVSKYAIENAMSSVKPFLEIASAENLPYPDNSFDLVISINSIHNLPIDRLKTALKEIQRVSRKHSYITIDAWRNETERINLYKWVLTAETMMHVDDWKKLFKEVGYTGDYWWFIAD
ncbi:MAG: class I SAM-dependent methyltransferase [Proteobacteria bacterium]|nr:class I SAM-dependent methyltransferase [Pseudomonadota bacterium]MBU1388910.1 class I SAM-dependent methyltransferase [Pseudomonadota bacterium]MBU1543462.1 class I SAM-dependent methyltransferase [Pseudomonadota bacterium]MBU2430272.1 class I SAM-dependent methyltransferase [Pseudomonadota bacterium]MBU2480767.1 class I SAM-dependent methyltransferase [Pseudomonadota bacterium]